MKCLIYHIYIYHISYISYYNISYSIFHIYLRHILLYYLFRHFLLMNPFPPAKDSGHAFPQIGTSPTPPSVLAESRG